MKSRSILQWGRTRRLAVYSMALPLLSCLTAATAAQAQTLTTLHSFNGTDGAFPSSALVKARPVQHSNGNFYSTTPLGGANGAGTVFQVTAAGAETTLYSFCSIGGSACTDGSTPQGALVAAKDGILYGTTFQGGANNVGTVFKITTTGALTTLYSFGSKANSADGANPVGALVQGEDGNLYGTTFAGGANSDGTAFVITTGGALTTLHSFSGPDGVNPGGDLVQSKLNDNFYGTTYAGGNSNNSGTLFEITPAGSLTTLWTFCSKTNCNDGSAPNVPLTQDSLGDFYGTTSANGANAGGTIFVLTSWGGFHTIYHFCAIANCADGAQPLGGPVLGSDFNIYGTTTTGGTSNDGTIYQFAPWHQLTTLHSFSGTDGANPESSLLQGADGNFYGTTAFGGANNLGTAYNLATLPPSGNACNGVYSGDFHGNLRVSSGQTCEFTDGAVIFGNVYETGGSLILTNATVLGNVEIQGGTYTLGPTLTIASKLEVQNVPSGSAQNTVCGLNVFGSLYYNGNASPAEIGSSAGSCPGNSIGGDLEVNSNTAAVQVFNNSVRDDLTCSSNSSITGAGNTARLKQGQCSTF